MSEILGAARLGRMELRAMEMACLPGYTSGQSMIEHDVFVEYVYGKFFYQYQKPNTPILDLTRDQAVRILSESVRMEYGWHELEPADA